LTGSLSSTLCPLRVECSQTSPLQGMVDDLARLLQDLQIAGKLTD
jgi:hypothetical protein